MKRAISDENLSNRMKRLSLNLIGTYTLFTANFNGDIEFLAILSNLERVIRYGIGPLALNIQPGGIHQELVVPPYVSLSVGKFSECMKNNAKLVESFTRDETKGRLIQKLYEKYPETLKSRFDLRSDLGKNKAIMEALTCFTPDNGQVCSAIIGFDTTLEDQRLITGFYDSQGRGPVFFKKIIDFTLGGFEQKLCDIFLGPFRNVWEIPTTKTNVGSMKIKR